MKVLRVGDKVKIRRGHDSTEKGVIDFVQEAIYNDSQDEMDYSLFHSGAWYHNPQLQFISSDGLKTLRRLLKEEECSETCSQ